MADRQEIFKKSCADERASSSDNESLGGESESGGLDSDDSDVRGSGDDVRRMRSGDDACRMRQSSGDAKSGVSSERPGRWQAAMSWVKTAVESGEEPTTGGGVRVWARRAVAHLVQRVVKKEGREDEPADGANGATDASQPQAGKTRRKRHYSPSRRGAQRRPWV